MLKITLFDWSFLYDNVKVSESPLRLNERLNERLQTTDSDVESESVSELTLMNLLRWQGRKT